MRKHYIVCSVSDHKIYKEVLSYPYILFSYLALSKNPELIHLYKNNELLIDSGAFSFLNGRDINNINIEEYIEAYGLFINKYNIKNFFELDLYKIIGVEKTLELRKQLEFISKRKCIPVFHKYLDNRLLKDMIDNYDYIGIGGFVTNEIKKYEYSKIKTLIDYCNTKNIKVHLLGRSLETVEKYDFLNYSQDSLGWKTSMYKSYYSIINNKLAINPVKSKFKLKKYEIENNNLKIFKYYMGVKGYGK